MHLSTDVQMDLHRRMVRIRLFEEAAGKLAESARLPGFLHLYVGEEAVAYLVEREWAHSADDILWRRTKLGLRLGAEERRRLADWLLVNERRLASTAA